MSVNFSVELSDDEPFERALRRFSSKTKRTGLMRDIKRKRFYTKPSVQKLGGRGQGEGGCRCVNPTGKSARRMEAV